MKASIKKSDFVLNPYMKSNDLLATFQILNTLIPYFCLWLLAVKSATISVWLLPPIIILMSLFSVRSFSLMHDCGHYSLFSSKKVNRCVGFLLGVINAIPQYPWSRDHAYHHKTNGDWERYRGVADFLSTEEFAKLSQKDRQIYQFIRQPIMAIPGGFFYLAIAPRMALVLGVYDLIRHVVNYRQKHPNLNWSDAISAHDSKHWQSRTEFWDLLLNNICVISSWVILCNWLGAGFFLSVYSLVVTLSAVVFIWVFFIQHIFEGSYANKTANWDYLTGAIEGSSYLELPLILKWFTADIGYHNIHHLSERIPNYYLEACHRQNLHLLSNVKTLQMGDMLDCARFILWDADSNSLVSIDSFIENESLKTELAPDLAMSLKS